MTSAMARLPLSRRWMPFMVSGLSAFEYSSCEGANRSTNVTPFSWHTLAMASVYSFSLALFSLPSGKLGLFRFSWAMGEKTTIFGADWPLYFWASMPASMSPRSFWKPASAPSPRSASL